MTEIYFSDWDSYESIIDSFKEYESGEPQLILTDGTSHIPYKIYCYILSVIKEIIKDTSSNQKKLKDFAIVKIDDDSIYLQADTYTKKQFIEYFPSLCNGLRFMGTTKFYLIPEYNGSKNYVLMLPEEY